MTTQEQLRGMVVKANTDKAASRKRLRSFLNSLALKPIKKGRVVHCCALCACPIIIGDDFRDAGVTRRAHEWCFQAVNKEIK